MASINAANLPHRLLRKALSISSPYVKRITVRSILLLNSTHPDNGSANLCSLRRPGRQHLVRAELQLKTGCQCTKLITMELAAAVAGCRPPRAVFYRQNCQQTVSGKNYTQAEKARQ